MKQFEQLADGAGRSKSTKFTDRVHLGNLMGPTRPAAMERTARSRANSIREVLAGCCRTRQTIDSQTKCPFPQVPQPMVIPTFGNWKKDSLNLLYAIDTQFKPKKSEQHLRNSSQRSSKHHPKFPRNSRLLSKFCSNELPQQTSNLPVISKTEKLADKENMNSPPDSQRDLPTRSTRHTEETELALLKREFARIYRLQRSRYQQILTENRINAKVDDREFQAFIRGLGVTTIAYEDN